MADKLERSIAMNTRERNSAALQSDCLAQSSDLGVTSPGTAADFVIPQTGGSYFREPGKPSNGPLARAMRNSTQEGFVAELRCLRDESGRSFGFIGRCGLPKATAHWMVTKGNFPQHEDQVRRFVMACGASVTEAHLWVTAWERVRWVRPVPKPTVKARRPESSHDPNVDVAWVTDCISVASKTIAPNEPGGATLQERAVLSELLTASLMKDVEQLRSEVSNEFAAMPDGEVAEETRRCLIALTMARTALTSALRTLRGGHDLDIRPLS